MPSTTHPSETDDDEVVAYAHEVRSQTTDWSVRVQKERPDPDNWASGTELQNITPLVPAPAGVTEAVAFKFTYRSGDEVKTALRTDDPRGAPSLVSATALVPKDPDFEFSRSVDLITLTSPFDSTAADPDDPHTAYQLCEFCYSSQEPQSNPEAVCDCVPFERSVAGGNEINERDARVLEVAEHAVLTHWASFPGMSDTPSRNPAVVLQRSHLQGGIGENAVVKIEFEGSLAFNLGEEFTERSATASIHSFRGDGSVEILVNRE